MKNDNAAKLDSAALLATRLAQETERFISVLQKWESNANAAGFSKTGRQIEKMAATAKTLCISTIATLALDT